VTNDKSQGSIAKHSHRLTPPVIDRLLIMYGILLQHLLFVTAVIYTR